MLSKDLEVSLHLAYVEARQQRHRLVTMEHLLLALLDNPSASVIFKACGADIESLRRDLGAMMKEQVTADDELEDADVKATHSLHGVIERMTWSIRLSKTKIEATGADALFFIAEEGTSRAMELLRQQHMSEHHIHEAIRLNSIQ